MQKSAWVSAVSVWEHLCSNPPYGYVKDPNDKRKWIVDEKAAELVKRIFDLCVAGKGPMQIAKALTADKVLTVKAYYAKRDRKSIPENLYRWSVENIQGILERPEYTGCTVNFKTCFKSHKLKKRLQNAPENYRIFPDRQPTIVDRNIFERVQELRANKCRPAHQAEREGLFSSLLYCADCGSKKGGKKRKREIAQAEKRIAELDRIFKRIYEDDISGIISHERFLKLSAEYEAEQKELTEKVKADREMVCAYEQDSIAICHAVLQDTITSLWMGGFKGSLLFLHVPSYIVKKWNKAALDAHQ